MRLQLIFIGLLATTSLSTSFIWRNFASARHGDAEATVFIVALAPVALAGMVLLSRIVVKARMPKRREWK